VVVLLEDNGLESQTKLIAELAEALNMPEDRVDLVDLNRASLNLKYHVA